MDLRVLAAQLLEREGSIFNQIGVITLQTTSDRRDGITATQPRQNFNSFATRQTARLRLFGISD
nr:hypothetical protein [Synechococcus sp. NOUM97013]